MTGDSQKICVGAILGAHGIKGAVRLRSFTEDPEALFDYAPLTDETGTRVFDLTPVGVMKDHYVAHIKGVTDRNMAEALRGTKICIAREDLPRTSDREYYAADLVGLTVVAQGENKNLGHVVDLHDYGAGAFLEIKPMTGATFMLPFKDAFVPHIDFAQKRLTAVIPEGWLQEEKPPKPEKQARKPKSKPPSKTEASNKDKDAP